MVNETKLVTSLKTILRDRNSYAYRPTDFWQEDFDFIEPILNEKWPEIRELFRLAYLVRVEQRGQKEVDEAELQEMLLYLSGTYENIKELFETMYNKSREGVIYKIAYSPIPFFMPKCRCCQ
jgi:hypothetical protein